MKRNREDIAPCTDSFKRPRSHSEFPGVSSLVSTVVHPPEEVGGVNKRSFSDTFTDEPIEKYIHKRQCLGRMRTPTVTLPERVVLGIWNHRNSLMGQVNRLERVIQELQYYINIHDLGRTAHVTPLVSVR